MTLADTQRLLSRLISAPEGIAAALSASPTDALALTARVRRQRGPGTSDRLGIYAHAYFARLRGALADDFGTLAATLGDAAFEALVRDFLVAHPPTSFTLRDAGARLADFLAATGPAERVAAQWPFAPDLARLEWALIEAFDAADAPALARDTLTAIAPERWAALRLHFVPSLRVIDLTWPVDELLVRAGETSCRPTRLVRRPSSIRIWRHDEQPRFLAIDVIERRVIGLARSGAPFGALCAEIANSTEHDADAVLRAATLLERWIGSGLVSGVEA